MGSDAALSRLKQIHAALDRVCACQKALENAGDRSSWSLGFLNSIYRQLHRGLTLTPRQEAVLTRIKVRLKGDEP
jgi:hypothetical protein